MFLTMFPIHSINMELTDTVHMTVHARGRENPALKVVVFTKDGKRTKKEVSVAGQLAGH